MTDLQMSLIAAGGVFVVGVLSYNKWQEYKARKSVERAFASDHDDVLMKTGAAPAAPSEPSLDRHEPVLDANADAPFAELAQSDALAEPVVREPASTPAGVAVG